VIKYKNLEESLEKTMTSMSKKSKLEKKVLELGVDNNLIRNLAEIFST
jgi:hypothetical protein